LALVGRVATQLQQRGVTVIPWTSAFSPGQQLLASILELVGRVDFGVFLFTPVDVTVMGGKTRRTVRDNVLFEVGVFMGSLGPERTFLLVPKNRDLHLPADLAGLITVGYTTNARGSGIRQAVSNILRVVEQKGQALRSPYNEIAALRATLDRCEFYVKKRCYQVGAVLHQAAKTRAALWHSDVDPRRLCDAILRLYGEPVIGHAYWWLVVHGVFRFKDIELFTTDDWTWRDSVKCTVPTERGAVLLNTLAAIR
jgi:hypothetical protein